MKALTIYQPWATLIMIGAKPCEFRRWDYRTRARDLVDQRIVVHASARPVRPNEVKDLVYRLNQGEDLGLVAAPSLELLEGWLRSRATLITAAGLGTAQLGTPRRASEIYAGTPDSDRIDEHVWGWPLTDVRPFEPPIPARGLQGFWEWGDRR